MRLDTTDSCAFREEEEKRRQAEEDAKAKEEAHLLELQRVQAEVLFVLLAGVNLSVSSFTIL